jgi:hypothetical protein
MTALCPRCEHRQRQKATRAARAARGTTPLSVLHVFRQRLDRHRDDGVVFDAAWDEALGHVSNPDWIAVLEQTRTTWKRAYNGQPAVGGEDAAARLGDLFGEVEHHESQAERLVA